MLRILAVSILVFACLACAESRSFNPDYQPQSSAKTMGPDNEGDLREIAIKDFACSEKQLVFREVELYRREVKGCHKVASYIAVCEEDGEDCDWQRDGDVSSIEGRPSSEHDDGIKEALGFSFRTTLGQTRSTCESSGGRFAEVSDGYTCSGSRESAAGVSRVHLAFCGEELCRVTGTGVLADDEQGNAVIKNLPEAMQSKYGRPVTQKRRLDGCRRSRVACVEEGETFFEARWHYPSGAYVEVSFSAKDKKARLKVRYSVQRASEKLTGASSSQSVVDGF